ncbi:MAG: ATP-dependent Clp protease adaptor ClpS [Spirochaetales bacterium]|nr:ATP-dependent Clp protease adaptor ClpS [Spirochaetales bacterium]
MVPGYEDDVLENVFENLKEPEMYRVVLHNDHYTPRDFVTEILRRFFQKSGIEATKIMLAAHKSGKSLVGIYTWDIAATKVTQVHELAKKNEFPLTMTIEQE